MIRQVEAKIQKSEARASRRMDVLEDRSADGEDVLEGSGKEGRIASQCRRCGSSQSKYDHWRLNLLPPGRSKAADLDCSKARKDELERIRSELTSVLEKMTELSNENQQLKKFILGNSSITIPTGKNPEKGQRVSEGADKVGEPRQWLNCTGRVLFFGWLFRGMRRQKNDQFATAE